MQQRWMAGAVVASVMLAAGAGGERAAAEGDSPRVPATASAYTPTEPCRVLDTRKNGARRPAQSTLEIDLSPCAPPEATTAAAITITAVDPADAGYAVAYPPGSDRPTASLVNWAAPGGAIANTGIIQTTDDAVAIYVRSAVDLVVDVSGFFVSAPDSLARAGRFVALPMPQRVLDTRRMERPGAGATTTVTLPAGAVPPDASAVLVNVTATETTGASYVTAWSDGPRPLVSFLNLDRAGQTRAGTTITDVADGRFLLYSHAGDQLVVDLIGYFTGPDAAPATDGLFVPSVPTRRLDTRAGSPIYGSGTIETANVAGGVFVGNLTMTETAQPGYLRVLPARRGASDASSVNADRRGATVANFVVSPASDHGLAVWSKRQAHAVLDQTGYFIETRLAATHPPAENEPPGKPTYPSAACARWDARLDYNIDPGSTGDPEVVPREVRQIGTSLAGRPIWAEYYGPWTPRHTVVVIGAVHGDECVPALMVDAARRIGATSSTVGYWVIPVLNPDGLAVSTRMNAAGADLNRDGFRVSQPESRALMAFTADVRPDLTVHVHSPYGFVGGYGPDPLGHQLAVDIAWATGMTRALSAGSKPGAEFLWEGQLFVHPHAQLLIELFPAFPDEATVDRPRLAPRPVGEVAEDATQAIAIIHQRLS